MSVLPRRMDLRIAVLGGLVAMACGLAACGGAAGAGTAGVEARQPAVEVAPAASTNGVSWLTVTPKPTPPNPKRASTEAVIAAYFEAAKQHRLDSMLDCFDAEGRAQEEKEPSAFSHVLSRPGVTIVSHQVTGASASTSSSARFVADQASIVVTVQIEEGGAARTLEKTFELKEIDREWFLMGIFEGAVI